MRWFTKLILTGMLLLSACAHNIERHNVENIYIIVHARSQHDLKVLMPALMRFSSPILADARINIRIKEIRFDVPKVIVSSFDDDEFTKYDDGDIHVFFVHEFMMLNKSEIAGARLASHGSLCKRAILITDKTNWTTLAHEVGHFFGLDHDKDDESNIMHTGWRDRNPVFSREQMNKMHTVIKRRRALCRC
jgi:hypothetical protein